MEKWTTQLGRGLNSLKGNSNKNSSQIQAMWLKAKHISQLQKTWWRPTGLIKSGIQLVREEEEEKEEEEKERGKEGKWKEEQEK